MGQNPGLQQKLAMGKGETWGMMMRQNWDMEYALNITHHSI
jgi:hypothetical protein